MKHSRRFQMTRMNTSTSTLARSFIAKRVVGRTFFMMLSACALSFAGTDSAWAQTAPRFNASYGFEHTQGFPNSGKPGNVDNSWLTNADDSRLSPGLQIQRTHVTERTVYYMPGTEMELIPFADLPFVSSPGSDKECYSYYMERYVRWYNYATDRKDSRLTFKPIKVYSNIAANDYRDGAVYTYPKVDNNGKATETYEQKGVDHDYGYFGSAYLTGVRDGSSKAYSATKLNGDIATFSIPAQSDLMDDAYVAFDLSRGGVGATDYNINIKNNTLYEPILTFRVLWTLKDARPWADSYSSTKEINEAYIKRHINHVNARAYTMFQVRLEHPEPVSTANPTDFWYKKEDGTYAQVMRYRVETWYNGQLISYWRTTGTDTTLPTVTDEGAAAGFAAENCAYNSKRGETFAQIAQHRFLRINKPKPGRYTVKVFALDKNNNSLKTADGKANLQLEEYELYFYNDLEQNASLLREQELLENRPHHTKEYLRSVYGEPRAVEDFDSYVPKDADGNYDNSYSSEYIRTTYNTHSVTDPNYSRGYNWPIPWGKTSYGRTLTAKHGNYGGHNVYAFVNFAAPVYAQNAANYTGQGFDRLYYDTGGGLNVDDDDYVNNTGELKDATKPIVKNPEAAKHGWMLWVNAAGDPGRIIDLDMGSDICVGSRIHVTGWMMETSNDRESANLMFKFYGVQTDGSEVLLNTYVTGYVPGGTGRSGNTNTWAPANQPNDNKDDLTQHDWYKGQWMHVYYNFTADASMTNAGYDHFILTLENNCTHSAGADILVDDIEVFLETPSVEVEETQPICDRSANNVKVNTDFDRLLASIGLDECTTAPTTEAALQDITYSTWYCFVDKANYDAALAGKTNPTKADYEAAFAANLVGDVTVDPVTFPDLYPYHHATFYTYYYQHSDYSYADLANNDEAIDDVAWKDLQIDYDTWQYKRYLVFNTSLTNDKLKPGRAYYVFFSPDKMGHTVIDDEFQQYVREHPIDVFEIGSKCAIFDHFVVTASNLIKIDGVPHPLDGDKILVCAGERPNIRVDMVGVNKENLDRVLDTDFIFDWYHDSYDSFTTRTTADGTKTIAEALTAFRVNYPEGATADVPAKTTGEGANAVSYTEADKALLMQLVADQELELYRRSTNVDMPSTNGEEYKMVIIPVQREALTSEILYCFNPQEVVFTPNNVSPSATDGFGDMKEYSMDDVPVRINLSQLNAVRESTGRKLTIPIYNANPTDESSKTEFVRHADTSIYLIDTNDPAYRDKVIADGDEVYPTAVRLPEVGNLLDMDIKMNRTPSKWHRHKENCITINFADDFAPREGFYYTLKVKFVEIPDGDNPSCPGDIIIPLKIVPLYQKWTGAAGNSDWNNDLNWTRADKTVDGSANDLMDNGTAYAAYATNAANGTAFCYAPMRDTRVQMKEGVEQFPALDANTYHAYGDGFTQNVLSLNSTATPDIEFDMVVSPAVLDTYTGDFNCVPYYQNSCREVHFGPATEMLRTDRLTYDRAWVEYRFSPDRWYTLGSPLQGVCSGDMYMPTSCTLDGTTIGAQQLTPLYHDIYFDNTLGYNDRFRPAVYQRGWDKAVANVYRIEGDGMTTPTSGNPWNVAVRGNWSHVYNDATVDYSHANGFSIKADISRLASTLQPDEVLMRLPKADKSYIYYTVDKTTDQRTTGDLDRTNAGRLLTDNLVAATGMNYTVTNETEGRMFLVANPFMCGLDINKFFEQNSNAGLNPKLWIVADNTQISCVKGADGGWISNDRAFHDVTMLQSFFVEAAADAKSINLRFTPDMMMSMNTPNNPGNMLVRSTTAQTNALRISLERDDRVVSSALIATNALAHNSYDEQEDAILLLDSNLDDQPSVYTVADGTAMSINSLRDIDVVPLGIICPDDEDSLLGYRLVFSGVDSFARSLYLYNAATEEAEPITEGMSLNVPAQSIGQYFVTTGLDTTETTAASDGPLYDLKGVRVANTRGERVLIQGGRKTILSK